MLKDRQSKDNKKFLFKVITWSHWKANLPNPGVPIVIIVTIRVHLHIIWIIEKNLLGKISTYLIGNFLRRVFNLYFTFKMLTSQMLRDQQTAAIPWI